MELADKLLAFKDDRHSLVVLLRRVYRRIGMSLPKWSVEHALDDVDPFTVFALFNQGQKDSARKRIAAGLAEELCLSSPVPSDFSGAAYLRGVSSYFVNLYWVRGRLDSRRIELLWNFYEAALNYADSCTLPAQSNSARSQLLSTFWLLDRAVRLTWKVTLGLYWIRPLYFFNLHPRGRHIVLEKMTPEVKTLVETSLRMLDIEQYIELCDRIKGELNTGVYEYKTLPELSAWAWEIDENTVYRANEFSLADGGQGSSLGDEGVQTVRYWLYAPGEGACMWEEFYERGVMGLGWHELGDLRGYATKEEMRQRLLETRDDNTSQTNSAWAVWQFANEMKPGDVVFVKKGTTEIIGRGIVTGDYVYDADGGHYPDIREVRWTHMGQWPLDVRLPMKTLTDITYNQELVELIKSSFIDSEESAAIEEEELTAVFPEYSAEDFLTSVYMDRERYGAIVGLLKAKKNIILQGAPGVGKTFVAKRLAYSMMGIKDVSRVKLVQFHQSYSYEDFIEGYRPSGVGFELVKGAFYSFCKKATDEEENDYFFIIDEINRGNLSKIFGELFMLIENDKRGNELQLLYSRELFSVPANVHIIGMMNTADRSLAMLDYALRRRFAFVELRPAFDSDGFREYCAGLDNPRFEALVREVESLNRAIAEDESLGEGFCIGHSYFCNMEADSCTDAALASIVDYELIPMLKEYWFDEPSKVREWSDRLHRSLR